MAVSEFKKKAEEILRLVGITIDGQKPWDMQVYNNKLYSKVLSGGSLALGESYMDGWWACKNLEEFFYRILKTNITKIVKGTKNVLPLIIKAKVINMQSKSRAFKVGEEHYDLGNDFYRYMLDKRMVYTCAYWGNGAKNLDEAQETKLELTCKKLGLKPGMKVLDIGCGWGSFLKYAAEKYKIKGLGVTISKEQAKLGNELLKKHEGVNIKLIDYRDLKGKKFDRIVSLGMFEHVGVKNYETYMKIAHDNLKENGLFLLHTIGSKITKNTTDPWTLRYIFPNSMLPSVKQIAESSEKYFITEDLHNFGYDYYLTLMEWYKNFNRNWKEIKKLGKRFDERFYRMWKYYLLSCAGSFKARNIQLWQIVFSRKEDSIRYKSIR